jgi:hypothetical protein
MRIAGSAHPEYRLHHQPNTTSVMYVIVEHTISDPAGFQAVTQAAELPAHLTLHQVLPNADGTRQVCLWEAADVGAVEAFVEPALAGLSTNTYFIVDPERALGLPVVAG